MQVSSIVLAGSVLLGAPVIAHPGNDARADRATFRQMRALNPDVTRRELRQMIGSLRIPLPVVPQDVRTLGVSSINAGLMNARLNNVLRNNQSQSLTNFGSNRSQFVNDAGRSRSVTRGLELDLTSDARSIVLGDSLFAAAPSYTISTGGQERILTAGSKVSAAEYVALGQVITGGAQTLVVDQSGRGVDGQFNLNNLSDGGSSLRAASLVVPHNVSAIGDFSRRADGLRVTNDLVNYGSVYAYSTNENQPNTVRIGARDINNELGGLISTDVPAAFSKTDSALPVNLMLKADRNINNSGAIVGAGEIQLEAGGALNNAGTIAAGGSISLATSSVTNRGAINSSNGNVNLAGAGDASLIVDNRGGTFSANNGSINVRSSQYTGTGNSTIIGGDLISKELNLFSGQGSADVSVNRLTGVVISSGTAAHVVSKTETLTIGTQCLTGDPTYFNDGNIVIAGDISVEEDLAIIASGNITTSDTNLTISARSLSTGQGFNISIIAGANILSGSGQLPGPTLPGQPPITQNAFNVSFSGTEPSATGGDVNLTGATSVLIDSSSTGTNLDGGNVMIAAFNKSAEGHVILPVNSQILASGSGTARNGSIFVLAGASSGTAIRLGVIDTRTGTGTTGGGVVISNTQPQSTDGNAITYDVTGKITSNNLLFPVGLPTGAGLVTVGSISASGSVFVQSGGTMGIGSVNALGAGADRGGNEINLVSINDRVIVSGLLDASGVGSGSGGTIFVVSNSDIGPTLLNGASVASGAGGGTGGVITVGNTGTGGTDLADNLIATGTVGGGSISVVSNGSIVANSVLMDVSSGVGGQNGTIGLAGSFISVTGTQLNLQAAATGVVGSGEITITTNAGGIFTDGADFIAEANSTLSLSLLNNSISASTLGLGVDGGEIRLVSPSIDFLSSSTDPLFLTADGDDTTSGGKITFSSLKPVATFIGVPAKLPKTPADFLRLSAAAGNSAPANGGEIIVAVGGSLTALPSPSDLNVSTSIAGGNGGKISLTSGGTFNKKGSPLVVLGGLNVDGVGSGDGGVIKLTSAMTKDFVVGSTKPPKNGVFGNLSAATTGGVSGSIAITNTLGGVQVVSSSALAAGKIEIEAGGKGKITTAKGVVIPTTLIALKSALGSIDVDYSAQIQAALSSAGSINLLNSFVGLSNVSASAGGSFTLSTAGGVTVDNAIANNGDLKIITGPNSGSNLTVNPGGTILALNGGILLQQLNNNGSIVFEDNVTIATGGKSENVVVAFGAAPKKPLNPSPPFAQPPLLDVNLVGKGQVFFGATPGNLITAGTTISTLNATNKNIILNVPVGNSGVIIFNDNVNITAGP